MNRGCVFSERYVRSLNQCRGSSHYGPDFRNTQVRLCLWVFLRTQRPRVVEGMSWGVSAEVVGSKA
jgi:hypothetical protein